jgi:hypothetical protein
MYIKEILMLLSWPVSIYASLLVIGWAIKKFDKILNHNDIQ